MAPTRCMLIAFNTALCHLFKRNLMGLHVNGMLIVRDHHSMLKHQVVFVIFCTLHQKLKVCKKCCTVNWPMVSGHPFAV